MQIVLLVCGDRKFSNRGLMRRILIREGVPTEVAFLIEGEAPGADEMSASLSLELGLPEEKIIRVSADWTQYKKAAGPIRNRKMLAMRPHRVLAFHEHPERSVGTANMVRIAERAKVSTWCSWRDL